MGANKKEFRVLVDYFHSTPCYEIHKVRWNDDGSLRILSTQPLMAIGETRKELQENIEKMQEALTKPSIDKRYVLIGA
jgi:hypothetical protein